MSTLSNNPAYQLEATFGKYRIYIPTDISNYHTSRYVQLQHQLIYANSGATSEELGRIADEILQRCNMTAKLDNRITDIGVLANQIKYRLQHPVDEHCAIRIGAILCFVEWDEEVAYVTSSYGLPDGVEITNPVQYLTRSENPDQYDIFYTKLKEELAMNDPAAYSFFLTWGVANIPAYKQHFDTSINLEYFRKRKEALMSLTPQ